METTIDGIIFEGLQICQPAVGGFRFGCDSVILANFARLKKNWCIADVGSGSGIIAALCARAYGTRVTAIELQDDMYSCLRCTVELSGLTEAITTVHSDIKEFRVSKRFDAVICNPPYRKASSGRVSGAELEKNARFSFEMDLMALLKFCKINMKHGGKLFFSYDADMLVEAISLCRSEAMEPKRLRFVHPMPGRAAKLLMMECVFGGGEEMLIEPPLYQKDGYNKEYEEIFTGSWDSIVK